MATHPPIRLLDTRAFGRPVVRGGVVEVDTGAPGKTVMATLSVVDPVAGGHTRVFPVTPTMISSKMRCRTRP